MQSPIIVRTDVETPADITVYFLSKLMGKVLQVSVFKSDKPIAFGGATISAPVKVPRQKVRPPKPARTSCNVLSFFNVWAALNIALMKGLTTPSTAEVDVALPPSKALVMSFIMSIGAVKMSIHWFIGIVSESVHASSVCASEVATSRDPRVDTMVDASAVVYELRTTTKQTAITTMSPPPMILRTRDPLWGFTV